MSRGPGHLQRSLLAALEQGEPVAVLDHFARQLGPLSDAQQVAMRRAGRRLVAVGRARSSYELLPIPDGSRCNPQLVLWRVEPTDQGAGA